MDFLRCLRILLPACAFVLALPVCGSPEYFNRTAAEADSKPDEVLKRLDLKSGERVADLGAGGGYFALRFARAVGPDGIVYAIDIDPKFREFVERAARKEGLANVKTVAATTRESGLADGSVDLIFVRNVFHHIDDRVNYLKRLRAKLRPNGRVVFIENAPGGARLPGHTTDPSEIKADLTRAGFRLLAEEKFLLPKQSFLVFGL